MLTWLMHLTLLVPGLLWPRTILHDTSFDLPLPALSLLLGRASRLSVADEETWLAGAFGIAAPLPAAPVRLLGDGGTPAGHDWLCLDPVHLRIEERAIVLDDPARLGLSPAEDLALREAVAPLIEAHGVLSAPIAGRWYLRLPAAAAIETRPLPRLAGRPADPMLPGGAAGPAWRRLLAELQPVLHAHPVNQARAAAGQPTIDSLWPWGAGRLPTGTRSSFDRLWTNAPQLVGLGALAGIAVEAAPDRFTPTTGRILARLDHLADSLAAFDALTWRDRLASLEADWLAPALAALRQGRCHTLSLIATGHDGAVALRAGRGDLWRFWKRPAALAELAA
jgi:hypothetical protein